MKRRGLMMKLVSLILVLALLLSPAASENFAYAEETEESGDTDTDIDESEEEESGDTEDEEETGGGADTEEDTETCAHQYESIVTEPTCTEDGYTTYTCSICGDTYTADYVDAAHTWDGNTCSICGTLKSTSLTEAEVTLSTTAYTYNGKARKPTPTVTLNGTELEKDTDYTVSYSDNTNAGTATVTVTAAEDSVYTDSIDTNFKINKKSISSGSLKLSTTSYTYSGKAKKPSTTVKVTLNSSKKTLTKNTDYTVTYKNNTKIGKATVTVTGTGNYKGTLKKTFTIKPKKVTLSSVKSTSAKKITVKWKKSSGNVKYQIAYRKKGSSTWKYKKVNATTYKKTLTGLSAAKYYYVKVRAYKKVSGKTYYGSWSSVKKVKAKSDKIVYLTFDDGPSANMGEILDILDKYNVKATFFVTGNNSKYRYLITRAYNEGHSIGLHSYTHNYSKIYASKSAFYKDLKKISDLVEDLTGEKSYLLRFPGGSSNTVSRRYCSGIMTKLTKSVTADGYVYFDWNCDSTDASGNNVAVSTIVKNATSCSAKKINILMHSTDAKDTTVEALPKIIKYYKNKGYDFEALDTSSYTAHHSVNN